MSKRHKIAKTTWVRKVFKRCYQDRIFYRETKRHRWNRHNNRCWKKFRKTQYKFKFKTNYEER